MNAILHPRSRAQTNRASKTIRNESQKAGDALDHNTDTELLTMATQTLPLPRARILDDVPQIPAHAASRGPSMLHRVFDAFAASQQRRARREVDRVLGPGAFERACAEAFPPKA